MCASYVESFGLRATVKNGTGFVFYSALVEVFHFQLVTLIIFYREVFVTLRNTEPKAEFL